MLDDIQRHAGVELPRLEKLVCRADVAQDQVVMGFVLAGLVQARLIAVDARGALDFQPALGGLRTAADIEGRAAVPQDGADLQPGRDLAGVLAAAQEFEEEGRFREHEKKGAGRGRGFNAGAEV